MKAYLFDVDGVLSDLKEKKVTESQLFEKLTGILKKGSPLGLNTGRSTAWMKKRIVEPLVERTADRNLFKNFFAVGEKGGTWLYFDDKGEIISQKDDKITVPGYILPEVDDLVDRKFYTSMFVDRTKETMVSIEMQDGFDLGEYHEDQTLFLENLQDGLHKKKVSSYRIVPLVIAVDIENPRVGKALGADRFLQFLHDKKINADEFITFGDSPSDLEMADELERKGQKVEFVYVGDTEQLGEVKKEYPVIKIGGYSSGTLEYLNKQ